MITITICFLTSILTSCFVFYKWMMIDDKWWYKLHLEKCEHAATLAEIKEDLESIDRLCSAHLTGNKERFGVLAEPIFKICENRLNSSFKE